MDNAQNCDSYINIPSSQSFRSDRINVLSGPYTFLQWAYRPFSIKNSHPKFEVPFVRPLPTRGNTDTRTRTQPTSVLGWDRSDKSQHASRDLSAQVPLRPPGRFCRANSRNFRNQISTQESHSLRITDGIAAVYSTALGNAVSPPTISPLVLYK
jgi:hypothetical protein